MAGTVLQPLSDAIITSDPGEVGNTPQKLLVFGQSNGGSAITSPLTLFQNVTEDQIPGLFDERTGLSHTLRAMKRISTRIQIDCIPFPDGTTAAVKTITFTGSGFGTGTLEFVIGSFKEHRFRVDVTSVDTLSTVAARLEALIVLDTACPFTSGVTAGVVTLTAHTKGKLAEKYPVRVTGDVSGLTVVIAITVAGAGDPTFTGAFDLVPNTRYQNVIWPWDDFTIPDSEMESRFNNTGKILDGALWIGEVLSHADLITSLEAENSRTMQHLSQLLEDKPALQGCSLPELPEVQYSMLAMIDALRQTPGTNLSSFVTTIHALDIRGGAGRCSLPYFNTRFPDLAPPRPEDGFSDDEIEQLTTAGGYIIGPNVPNTEVLAGEVVTTYKTKPNGTPDPTFKFKNQVKQSTVAREFMAENVRAEYAQSRAIEGPTATNSAEVNVDTLSAFMELLFERLGTTDFNAVERGREAKQFFVDNLFVTLVKTTGTFTIIYKLPVVGQAREFLQTITITLETIAGT